MSAMSQDKPPKQDETNNQVQDYLDMLLMSATEQPSAQVDAEHKPEPIAVQAVPTHQTRGMAKLALIGGAHVKTTSLAPARSKLPEPQPIEARPFAEPKSLKLSVTLAKAQPTKPLVEEANVKPKPEVAAEPVVSESSVIISEPEIEFIDPAVEAEAPVSPAISTQVTEITADAAGGVKNHHATSTWMENGRPEWAQQPFECLLFKTGGLALAVPLVELGTIYPLTEELTPLFGQADWFMGLLTVREHNIRTVNTAKIVMPERYNEGMRDGFRYVLSINGVDWGLAVDNVANAVMLDPNTVKWRSERSKRPWLAGTVVDHMCALLDVSQLAAMFVGKDKN